MNHADHEDCKQEIAQALIQCAKDLISGKVIHRGLRLEAYIQTVMNNTVSDFQKNSHWATHDPEYKCKVELHENLTYLQEFEIKNPIEESTLYGERVIEHYRTIMKTLQDKIPSQFIAVHVKRLENYYLQKMTFKELSELEGVSVDCIRRQLKDSLETVQQHTKYLMAKGEMMQFKLLLSDD